MTQDGMLAGLVSLLVPALAYGKVGFNGCRQTVSSDASMRSYIITYLGEIGVINSAYLYAS